MSDEIIEVSTTTETEIQAQELARQLIMQRLAACVQISESIQSYYRWKGEICESREYRLTIKTLPTHEPQLMSFLAQHHPYELPEFMVNLVRVSPAYAKWVAEQVESVG